MTINLHTDNPAGRLLTILTEGRKYPQGNNCKQVWATLLDVDQKNQALLMSRLGKLMELPEQIINQIKEHYPNQNNTHRHWSVKVNTAFSEQNLNGSWREFIQHIDEHTINYLSLSADLLDNKEKTQILTEEKLTDIYEQINSLLLEIIDLDIDDEFKKQIIKYLRSILVTIEEYKISGSVPIVESIESLFGHAFFDKNYHQQIATTSIGKKLLTVLTSVASVVTIAAGLPELPNTLNFLLGNSDE